MENSEWKRDKWRSLLHQRRKEKQGSLHRRIYVGGRYVLAFSVYIVYFIIGCAYALKFRRRWCLGTVSRGDADVKNTIIRDKIF